MSLLAACSSTRHQGFFHPKFENPDVTVIPSTQSPAPVQPLVASTESGPVLTQGAQPTATTIEAVRKTYLQMNKEQRKEFRKELKSEIKHFVKVQKGKIAPDKTTAGGMDHDLKLAAIFGAVGIVALIIGGDVFWIIGGIALLIGVIFFVKWLVRQ